MTSDGDVSALMSNMKLANTQMPRKPYEPTNIDSGRTLCSCRFIQPRHDPSLLCRLLKQYPRPPTFPSAKLHKPPKFHVARKSRNRLQRRRRRTYIIEGAETTLFVLQYDSHPYDVRFATILGVFSSLDKASAAAISCGAFAFSKGGLNSGMEYLTPTGKINIVMLDTHLPPPRRRSKATEQPDERRPDFRPDIPHPNDQLRPPNERNSNTKPVAYIALYRTSERTSCIGVFGEKIKAWNICLKHHTTVAYSSGAQQETRWMDEHGLPHIKARIEGSGWECWDVRAFKINDVVGPIAI
ncbi:hypothetical protein CC78DRAFT_531620 [Lojkania enalia]|uniref:Uncharacterized protein n=1 Tax=Lojkania enalia TaxID=147567 RepID=A0A9P4KEQ5_9PLEO|nr:hypothetical protein CC78DRAFT_531620 [Didymosphaeria enalia]